MMDDVVGLVLAQVISKLGLGPSSFHAITIVRPIVVSIDLGLSVLLTCRYLVKPVSSLICGPGAAAVMRAIQKKPDEAVLIAHTALLSGIMAASSYAGTSNLFAAYLAGASISWYYSEVAQPGDVEKRERIAVAQSTATGSVQHAAHNESHITKNEIREVPNDGTDRSEQLDTPGVASTGAIQEADGQNLRTKQPQGLLSGAFIYKEYIEQPVARILNPFFFASADKIHLCWVKALTACVRLQ